MYTLPGGAADERKTPRSRFVSHRLNSSSPQRQEQPRSKSAGARSALLQARRRRHD